MPIPEERREIVRDEKLRWCAQRRNKKENRQDRKSSFVRQKRDARERDVEDEIRTCVRARKRGFGACGRPRQPFGYITSLPSGNSSATRAERLRRLHHTYAAEHYITDAENDEPRVQSPGTLASSTCVMRRAQRAAAQQRGGKRYTRNSRNRNDRRCICIVASLSIRSTFRFKWQR